MLRLEQMRTIYKKFQCLSNTARMEDPMELSDGCRRHIHGRSL